MTHKKLIEKELHGFGIRLNQRKPNVYFKRHDKGNPPPPPSGLGFRNSGSSFRISGSGFRIPGCGFQVWGLGNLAKEEA